MTSTVVNKQRWYVTFPKLIGSLSVVVQISVCAGLTAAGAMSAEWGGNDANIVAAAALYDS
jgi:hypothetical protein